MIQKDLTLNTQILHQEFFSSTATSFTLVFFTKILLHLFPLSVVANEVSQYRGQAIIYLGKPIHKLAY